MARDHVIWKYPITSFSCTIEMPDGAVVVGFGDQDGQLVLWARVDPAGGRSARKFRVVGTGMEFDCDLAYYGFTQAPSGLVWHLLEDLAPVVSPGEQP